MFRTQCGQPNPLDARFCFACPAPTVRAGEQYASVSTSQPRTAPHPDSIGLLFTGTHRPDRTLVWTAATTGAFPRIKVLLLACCITCCSGAAQAQTPVQYSLTISNQYSAIEFADENVSIPAGFLQPVQTQLKPTTDNYVAVLRFQQQAQIVLRVLDAATSQVILDRAVGDSEVIVLPQWNRDVGIAVGNVGALPVGVALTVFRVGLRDDKTVEVSPDC